MARKNILLVLVMVVIGFPLIHSFVPFINSKGLDGSFAKTENVPFRWKDWWEGTYQAGKDQYWKDNFSFRPDFVRLYNEILYSGFGKICTKDVVEGKNGFFYEKGYIDSYLGKGAYPDSIIEEEVQKIKTVQDFCKAHGKRFVFVIATGKGWICPESFPPTMDTVKQVSNYEKYLRFFDRYGIQYVDFNGFFYRHRKQYPYPIVTKQGTHWSSYGAALAMDSLVGFMNQQMALKLRRFVMKGLPSKKYNAHDKEITIAFNLIRPIPEEELTFQPEVVFDSCTDCSHVNAIISADSYFWEPSALGIFPKTFDYYQFWYYNNHMWSSRNEDKDIVDAEALEALMKTDVLIMLSSEIHIEVLTDHLLKIIALENNKKSNP